MQKGKTNFIGVFDHIPKFFPKFLVMWGLSLLAGRNKEALMIRSLICCTQASGIAALPFCFVIISVNGLFLSTLHKV